MGNEQFDSKWNLAGQTGQKIEEFTIFVPPEHVPQTQRQFNLYNYFEFIGGKAQERGVKNALEVGCGRGTISLYLRKYLGVEVSLVDISDDAVLLAKKNFDFHNAVGAIKKDDAENLSFADDSFDLITSIGLAEHFHDYTKVFKEQYRVLRSGGSMISLNIPKKFSIQFLNKLYRIVIGFASGVKLNKDYFRNSDTPADYKKHAEECGFKNVRVFYVNSFPLFTPMSRVNEQRITKLYRMIYKLRGIFMEYPFKGSKFLSQAHFLIGEKFDSATL